MTGLRGSTPSSMTFAAMTSSAFLPLPPLPPTEQQEVSRCFTTPANPGHSDSNPLLPIRAWRRNPELPDPLTKCVDAGRRTNKTCFHDPPIAAYEVMYWPYKPATTSYCFQRSGSWTCVNYVEIHNTCYLFENELPLRPWTPYHVSAFMVVPSRAQHNWACGAPMMEPSVEPPDDAGGV